MYFKDSARNYKNIGKKTVIKVGSRGFIARKKNNLVPRALKGFTKQDKTILRKFAKKFEYDSKLESLFYVAKEKDGTALRRLVIAEEDKARVFEECHSAPFSGHAGRDNTLRKIKERFYWPDYYKDTIEMVTV